MALFLYFAISAAFAIGALIDGHIGRAAFILEASWGAVLASLTFMVAIANESGWGRAFVLLLALGFFGMTYGLASDFWLNVAGYRVAGMIWALLGVLLGLVYAPKVRSFIDDVPGDRPDRPSRRPVVTVDALDEPDSAALERATMLLRKQPLVAIQELRALADQGSIAAMLELGRAYEDGTGVEQNPTEGESWFRLAAAKGSVRAHRDLGRVLRRGKRFSEAKQAYEYSAARGDAIAEMELGRFSLLGLASEKSRDQARRHFERASERGSLYARVILARMTRDDARDIGSKMRSYLLIARAVYAILKAEATPRTDRE